MRFEFLFGRRCVGLKGFGAGLRASTSSRGLSLLRIGFWGSSVIVE